MNDDDFDVLVQEWIEGTLDQAASDRLEVMLKDPTRRARMLALVQIHRGMAVLSAPPQGKRCFREESRQPYGDTPDLDRGCATQTSDATILQSQGTHIAAATKVVDYLGRQRVDRCGGNGGHHCRSLRGAPGCWY
jgi:hypothetical protein